MNYKDIGFNNFFQKQGTENTQQTELESSQSTPNVSGSAVNSGISRSSDKKTIVDWDKGYANFSDGARNRVIIGNLNETGKYGIRVVDRRGNTRFESSDFLELISMYDTNNNEVVRLDTNGLTINSGKITIKNDDDTTVLDSLGLVSTAAFSSSSVSYLNPFSTTSLTYTNITNMQLVTPIFSRAQNFLVMMSADLYGDRNAAGDWEGQTTITLDALKEYSDGGITDYNPMDIVQRSHTLAGDSNSDITTLSNFSFVSLSRAGKITFTMQMKATSLGTGNFKANGTNFTLAYVVLGT